MDTPNDQPDPPVRHFVREWNDDGTVKNVREVVDFASAKVPPFDPTEPFDTSGWVSTKQITGTVKGWLTTGSPDARPPMDD